MKKLCVTICAALIIASVLVVNAYAAPASSHDGMPIQDGLMFDHWHFLDVEPSVLLRASRNANGTRFHSPEFSVNVSIGGNPPRIFTRNTRFFDIQQRALNFNDFPQTRFQAICVGSSIVRDFLPLIEGNNVHTTVNRGGTLSSNGNGNFRVNINNVAGVRTEIWGLHD